MPLLWISIAFIAGAVVSFFLSVPWAIPAITGIIFAAISIFERGIFSRFRGYTRIRSELITPLFLLAAAFCGGMVRGDFGKPEFSPRDLGWYNGQETVTLRAIASQPVENHDKSTLLSVSAVEISTDGLTFVPVDGEAVILLPAGRSYAYGNRLEITGHLQTPPERADFSYKQYLENRGVFSYLSYPQIKVIGRNFGNPLFAVIYTIRDRIATACTQTVPQPEAAFLSGILVGRDEEISDALKQSFQNTGTSHLVAISGFNITILSGLILAMTNRLLSRGWSVVVAIILLCAYAFMAGASPSVVRAAIMGVLAMLGRSIGRTRTAVNSLGLAAAGMVLINPLILQDIGFQLSVAATAGILVIGAPLNDRFVEKMTGAEKPSESNLLWCNIGDYIIITLAAQAATLPLLLYHFHQYPLIGLLVNPLVLPVQPAAMVMGGLAALAGVVFLPVGKILGMIAWIPLAFTTRVVELFSVFHTTGLISLRVEIWQAAVLGFALLLAVVFQNLLLKQISKWVFEVMVIGLTVLLVFMINALYLYPDGRLHIQVFRQGKDLSTFIQTPGGQHLLVTNRPGDKDLFAFVDRRLPFLDKHLDALILPNPTASSSIGLADTIAHFKPEWLLVNTLSGGYRVQSKLNEVVDNQIGVIQPLESSARYDLGIGAILSIQQINDNGSELTVIWGTSQVDLLYGISTTNDMNGLFQLKGMDVLIQDHPDNGSSTGRMVDAVFSVDADAAGAGNTLVVPDGGWLEIVSDGMTYQLMEKTNGFP
jgi:competence protein ComEC